MLKGNEVRLISIKQIFPSRISHLLTISLANVLFKKKILWTKLWSSPDGIFIPLCKTDVMPFCETCIPFVLCKQSPCSSESPLSIKLSKQCMQCFFLLPNLALRPLMSWFESAKVRSTFAGFTFIHVKSAIKKQLGAAVFMFSNLFLLFSSCFSKSMYA